MYIYFYAVNNGMINNPATIPRTKIIPYVITFLVEILFHLLRLLWYLTFIYYFKDNFQFYAKKMTPPVDVELIKFVFEYDSDSDLNLILETKSGEVLIQDKTALYYSLVRLSSDLDKGRRLPEGIKEAWFTHRNNDLEIREQYILDWEVLLDYVENDITIDQLLASLRTP